MAIIGSLKAILSAQAADYKKGMDAAARATKQAQRDITRSGKKIERVGRSFQAAGATLTAGITAPVVGLATLAARAAISFESAFTGVRKTVSATTLEFAALESGIREMSLEIPVAAGELAGIAEAGGQLGIAKEHILGFTRTIADMSVTTNLTATAAASDFARIANITALPQEKFENLGSAIVALGNTSATTEVEITAMALRLGAAGKLAGLSTEETLGMAAALSSVGIQAEAGGSAMSRIMKGIVVAVAEGGEALQGYADVAGTTTAEFAVAFEQDAAGAIETFLGGLGKLSGPEALGALDGLGISAIRTSDAALRLAGAGELLGTSLDTAREAFGANTALAAEAELRYGTTESSITLAKNAMDEMGRVLGAVLLPIITSTSEAIRGLVPHVQSMAEWFQGLPGWVQSTALVFGVLFAALGPVLLIVGQMAIGLGGLVTVTGLSAAAMGVLAAKITLAVGVFTLAYKATSALMDAVVAFAPWTKTLADGFVDLVAKGTGLAGVYDLLIRKNLEATALIDKETGLVTGAAAAWERQKEKIREAGLAYEVLGEGIEEVVSGAESGFGKIVGSVGEFTGATDEATASSGRLGAATRAAAVEAEAAAERIALAAEAKRLAEAAATDQIAAKFLQLQNDLNLAQAEGLQKRLLEIDISRQEEIAGIAELRAGYATEYAELAAMINEKYGLMKESAQTAHAEIAAAAKDQGFSTRAELQQTADKAVATYKQMLASGKFTLKTLQAAWEAAEEAKRELVTATEEHQLTSAEAVVQGSLEIFQVLGKKFKAAAIAGAIIATYQAVAKALASAPWPANLVLAAGALAAGLANVNKIRGAKEGWRTGTPGTQFENFGAGSMEMLHGREAVVTPAQGRSLAGMVGAAIRRAQGAQMSGGALGSPMAAGGVGGVSVTINLGGINVGDAAGADGMQLGRDIAEGLEDRLIPTLEEAIGEIAERRLGS